MIPLFGCEVLMQEKDARDRVPIPANFSNLNRVKLSVEFYEHRLSGVTIQGASAGLWWFRETADTLGAGFPAVGKTGLSLLRVAPWPRKPQIASLRSR